MRATMLRRALAIVAILGLVLLPAFHVHGGAGEFCVACAHAWALSAPPPPVALVFPVAEPGLAAPVLPARPLRANRAIHRPVALSPPAGRP